MPEASWCLPVLAELATKPSVKCFGFVSVEYRWSRSDKFRTSVCKLNYINYCTLIDLFRSFFSLRVYLMFYMCFWVIYAFSLLVSTRLPSGKKWKKIVSSSAQNTFWIRDSRSNGREWLPETSSKSIRPNTVCNKLHQGEISTSNWPWFS